MTTCHIIKICSKHYDSLKLINTALFQRVLYGSIQTLNMLQRFKEYLNDSTVVCIYLYIYLYIYIYIYIYSTIYNNFYYVNIFL